MPAIFSRADPSAAPDVSRSLVVNTTSTPNREEKRLFSPQGEKWAKQFEAKVKADLRWMKQFLHGGR